MLLALLLAAAAPDLSGVVSFNGPFNYAFACPVAADLALTAQHVVNMDPLDATAPLFGGRYADGDGNAGILTPGSARLKITPSAFSQTSDLAVVTPTPAFRKFYKVAKVPPAPGDTLWIVYREFDSKRGFFERKTHKFEVKLVQGGTIIPDDSLEFGSSGGCAVNKAGEVVGIVSKTFPSFDRGDILGVWGDWLELEGIRLERMAEEPK